MRAVNADPNALFARAEAAFCAGRYPEARRDLRAAVAVAGEHPAVLHLLALVERRAGEGRAAADAFVRALRAAPDDPQINNNYANLLGDIGEREAALRHYDRALAAAPGFADARLNRALLLQELGRPADALADLDALDPSARLHAARGGVLRDLDRLDEAAAAFDAALALDPARAPALVGRARVALERGEADASERYARALAVRPDDEALLLDRALAAEAEGGASAEPQLAAAVARRPLWADGHEQLARMRAEMGDADDPARSFRDALTAVPGGRALHLAYWGTLIHAGRYEDALHAIDLAPPPLRDDREALLLEALAASEAGTPGRADGALARLGDAPEAAITRARHDLRCERPDAAAAALEPVVAAAPDDVHAWALLSLAWRMLGHPRYAWLAEQPGLHAAVDLPFAPGELDELAALLRSLHRTRAHPIGQSLRGGTQTRGRLFARTDPLLRRLRERLEEAVAQHLARLPPRDDAHPLLRHRDGTWFLAGSWSVRLQASGFHVNHVHPLGVLSSAFYVALPPSLGRDDTRAGWLDLGAPPVELGLDLPPLATIEPRPGRLALFPSYLFHGTRPFASGERLTIAFDVAAR